MEPTFSLKTELWQWTGKAAWHFLTIPEDIADQIKSFSGPKRGFGSVRVKATIGESTWKTSIFPEKKGTYLLPVKKDIRKKEGIADGDKIQLIFSLE